MCRALGRQTPAEVRALRERLGLTVRELARRLEVTEACGSRWESGERLPSVAEDAALRALETPALPKPPFTRRCPDCRKPYRVTDTYTDEAYLAHARNESHAVCPACFEGFDGATVETLAPSRT